MAIWRVFFVLYLCDVNYQKLIESLFVWFVALPVTATNLVFVRVTDQTTRRPVADVSVSAGLPDGRTVGTISDAEGIARLRLDDGVYLLEFSHVAYYPFTFSLALQSDTLLPVCMQQAARQLREVVITASESRTISSSSTIGREAMNHLQPTSLGDLMELLPGGISKTPSVSSADIIALRETGTLGATGTATVNSAYQTHALGTLFLVDGAPVQTEANLQYTPQSVGTAEGGRNITNRGVDMRTIGTDDIEQVEIIRGIPSVEYGNLTSGVVNIRKIRRPTKLNARFKADGQSVLFSAGKGLQLDSARRSVLNLDAGLLHAYADPRNPLETYRRATFSARLTHQHENEWSSWRWTPSLDYTGSFDNSKIDPEINYGNTDEYKSTYQRLAVATGVQVVPKNVPHLSRVDASVSVSQQFDRLERERLVSPQRAGIAPASTEPGEYDAYLLFGEYMAEYAVDGKPFNAYAKLSADLDFRTDWLKNTVKAGTEWSLSKNFGRGQEYDLSHPLLASGWNTRPRAYYSIPAMQTLAVYVQDNATVRAGNHTLEVRAGVRATTLPGLSDAYDMYRQWYADPRLNMQWSLPAFGKRQFRLSFSGGIGWTTRMPTLNYLYPDPTYCDIIQLGYYSQTDPQNYSRYYIRSYRQDPTNYALQPARNRKWEVRADMELAGNRLWICFFEERMSSGFRYSNTYGVYAYKDYDESAINSSALQGKPQLDDIPYVETQRLYGYSFVENGSRQDKTGVEMEFTSQRIRPLRTAVKLGGAWFRSLYSNSRPMYYAVSAVVDNVVVSHRYVGLYDWNDGRRNEQLSTNLLLDTQLPEWGLIFSTSIQTMWYVSTQRLRQNSVPVSYLSADDGQLHPYTDEAVAANPLLQHLIYPVSEAAYLPYTIPPALYVNIKVTKSIRDFMQASFFVNRLLDYTPDFERNGILIRRNVSPYFGMEMTLKL